MVSHSRLIKWHSSSSSSSPQSSLSLPSSCSWATCASWGANRDGGLWPSPTLATPDEKLVPCGQLVPVADDADALDSPPLPANMRNREEGADRPEACDPAAEPDASVMELPVPAVRRDPNCLSWALASGGEGFSRGFGGDTRSRGLGGEPLDVVNRGTGPDVTPDGSAAPTATAPSEVSVSPDSSVSPRDDTGDARRCRLCGRDGRESAGTAAVARTGAAGWKSEPLLVLRRRL